jgi:5-(carboxyamino)imidazole ribonucleotide synthase
MKRIGVIGGGQLAWMMASAAKKLGVSLRVQTPQKTDPAAPLASEVILAAIADANGTAQLAEICDVITFENEFVDLEALSQLEQQGVCFRPKLSALAPLLDKYDQRCYLKDIGLPVPKFMAFDANQSATELTSEIGWPLVMKARRHGYDGQGTVILQDASEFESTWQNAIGRPSVLIEEFVPFDQELAIIAARSHSGEVSIYPIVQTQQENQVCRRVIVPAEISANLVTQCEQIAERLLNSLDAVGIFGIELFLTRDRQLLVNEIAPRTHNSGHFSQNGAKTCQFEQHLRAVAGLPLGSTALTGTGALMVNLLGYENSHDDYQAKRQQLAQIPGAQVHWYGKTESRPGRKLGHVNVVIDSSSNNESISATLQKIAQTIESIWYPSEVASKH